MPTRIPSASKKNLSGRRKPPPLRKQPRSWYLWLPSFIVTVLLALGIAIFLHPGMKWRAYALIPSVLKVLPQLALGLFSLVILEAFYIIEKVRELRELRDYVVATCQEAGVFGSEYTLDGLTGALDRRTLPQVLRRESTWVDRYRIPLCLVLCDIRGFAKLNEKEGHLTGDLVLKEFAQVLEGTVRQTDSVLRYGPDEFLCLLPRTDSDGGAAFARRVREACQRSPQLRDVVIDSGIAVYEPGTNANVTLTNAERDLATQKSSSRGSTGATAQASASPMILRR